MGTKRGRMTTVGTGKPGQYTVRQLPDGRVSGTFRVTGDNVVRARVGDMLTVMTWLSTLIVMEVRNDYAG